MTKEELNRIEEAWWNSKEGIIAMAEVFQLAEKGLSQEQKTVDGIPFEEWRAKHYKNSYNEGFMAACHLYDRQQPIDFAKYCEEHGEVIVDKDLWEDARKALEQQKICADCNKKMDEIRRAYDNMLERKVEFDLKVCDMDKTEDVCCNCKHNIRSGEVPNIECHCDIDGSWLSYLTVMGHKCERWESDERDI